jgi:hypothetical protein
MPNRNSTIPITKGIRLKAFKKNPWWLIMAEASTTLAAITNAAPAMVCFNEA